jgi:hypothetical protein
VNKKIKDTLQDKREALTLLREKDRRDEKDPEQMLESELDKEISWRTDPNRYETSESILKEIHNAIDRIERKMGKGEEWK